MRQCQLLFPDNTGLICSTVELTGGSVLIQAVRVPPRAVSARSITCRLEVANQAADQVFYSLLPHISRLLVNRWFLIVDGATIALTSNPRLREVWPPISNQHGSFRYWQASGGV